ncbi:hypothetical protein D3C87_589800 [compost metagenome]
MKRIETVYLHIILKGSPLAMPGYSENYKIDHDGKRVTIIDCEVVGHLVFDEDFAYPYSIHFQNCSFAGNFVIHKGTFKDVTFSGIRHGLYLFAVNGGTFESFNFSGSSILQSDIKIQGGEFRDLGFQSGSSFKNSIFIGACKIKTLALMDAIFDHPVGIMQVTEVSFVLLRNVQMTELEFYDGDYGSFDIETKSTINKLKISGGSFGSLRIRSENIAELSIEKHAKNVDLSLGKITFGQMGKVNGVVSGCKIGKLEFSPSYIHKDTILRVLNVSIESLSFNGLVNYGQLGFSNLELEKELSISRSDLGKTSFINSNLSDIKMSFEDSRITDTFFSKGTFPQRIAEDEHQQRQAYAQLKKINEGKGDYLEANHFYAKEMNAFYRTITWRKNFWEKLNLCFNKYSNDHGQSWQLALAVVAIGSSLFFAVYLLGLNIRIGSISEPEDRDYFLKCLSYLPEFLNPVHRTDEIAKGIGQQASPWARLVEGFSRIFIAFAIYQLIQAFRKHGKK